MRLHDAVVFAALAACGKSSPIVSVDAPSSTIDAPISTIDANPIDSAQDAGLSLDAAGPIDPTYLKASNTDPSDEFGFSIAMSADGLTLAVGAVAEASDAIGIDGNPTNNGKPQSGAVYVFARSALTTSWAQQAYVKASDTTGTQYFGTALALSSDGSTLAVGAPGQTGSAYVYTRIGALWGFQAELLASNTGRQDNYGTSITLSADGATLVVGAPLESSNATGINHDQTNHATTGAGAAYIFTRTGATWQQQAYVKASNTGAGDQFGSSVVLSGDGAVLAIGAQNEASAATGVGGSQADNSSLGAGAVYVFTRTGASWSQTSYLKASNASCGFGGAMALSADGTTLGVGARCESSKATGIDGDQTDHSVATAGAVYIFTAGATWTQQAYLKASNTGALDEFGFSLAFSANGSALAVGAIGESSAATTSTGNQADDSAPTAGAVYRFTRTSTIWAQQAYVKAPNTNAGDQFGRSVTLSSDGSQLAVGAIGESSSAAGVDGDEASNAAFASGAAYLFD